MGLTDRIIQRVMLLILVLILVQYYQGAGDLLQKFFSAVTNFTTILQGRNPNTYAPSGYAR